MTESSYFKKEFLFARFGGGFFFSPVLFFFVGLLGACGWIPHNIPLFFLCSLSFLAYGIWRIQSPGFSFVYGWLWGVGLWLGHLFWIGESLYVQPHRFAWLLPFALVGVPAVLAIYCGACTWASSKIRGMYPAMTPLQYMVSFGLLWNLLEVAQGHLFTGFPWNLTAYIWHHCPEMMQGAAFLGSYGLGFCTVMLFLVPLGFFLHKRAPFLQAIKGYYLCGAILCGIYCAGAYRLREVPTFHKGIFFRLVQPCISQKEKINPALAHRHFALLVDLSRQSSMGTITHVLWPESAVPWTLTPQHVKNFPEIMREVTLLTGVGYADGEAWNSLLVKSPHLPGEIVYHKHHLLPLGEYMPCRALLETFVPTEWVQKITPGKRDFSHGSTAAINGTVVSSLPGTPPFRPFICYESIFPSTISPWQEQRPQWIFVMTNDAWFGNSPGPYQHFVSACFRSVEEGLPLLRVANTGISAVVDPWGRVIHILPLDMRGCIDTELPHALPSTVYSRFGISIWGILWGICALIFLVWVRRDGRGP